MVLFPYQRRVAAIELSPEYAKANAALIELAVRSGDLEPAKQPVPAKRRKPNPAPASSGSLP